MNRWTWTEVSFQLLRPIDYPQVASYYDVHTFVGIVLAQQAVCELPILEVAIKLPNSWDGLGWHHFLDRWHCLNGSTTTVIILNVSFNIENTFTLCSLSFHCAKLQFEVCCNHLIVWSYCGFIKSNCDDVNDENEGTCTYMYFLPLKFSQYPSRPVPVPELFGKYPTRPVPKSKTPTRRTLPRGHSGRI